MPTRKANAVWEGSLQTGHGKMDDDEADARRNPVSTEPNSGLSCRNLDEVREGEPAPG
jgi:hypothetical protein